VLAAAHLKLCLVVTLGEKRQRVSSSSQIVGKNEESQSG
jgi:hypothetical protein